MLNTEVRQVYKITVDIDITYKIDHWTKIKSAMGLVSCIQSIRDAYPFISLTQAKEIAESL